MAREVKKKSEKPAERVDTVSNHASSERKLEKLLGRNVRQHLSATHRVADGHSQSFDAAGKRGVDPGRVVLVPAESARNGHRRQPTAFDRRQAHSRRVFMVRK